MGIVAEFLEILISGFITFLTIFFFILNILGVKDLRFLSFFNDYQTVIWLVIVGISYLLGYMVHRLLLVFIPIIVVPIKRLFKKGETQKKKVHDFRKDVVIWQNGSNRIHHVLKRSTRLITLFRSFTVITPLLGINLYIWLFNTNLENLGFLIVIFCIISGILSYILYRYEEKRYRLIRDTTFRELSKKKK